MRKLLLLMLVVCMGVISCKDDEDGGSNNTVPEAPSNIATPEFVNLPLLTNKAIYSPGDAVVFTINNSSLPATVKVRYKLLNTVISENALSSASWTWTAPSADFKGYTVEVFATENGAEKIYATTAVDVSSEWTKFPRYGFLSKFGQMTDDEISSVISNLNRYHINGIQFYDWMNKHHKPLPMNGTTPAATWKDIINRDMYFSTVEKYIASAHSYNMKAMFYNLVFGAWKDAEDDGVKKEWFVYTNSAHTNKDLHPLPTPPFLSNIYLLDPSNIEWQNYINAEHEKVYQYLNFDGFHMDQLGDRGARFKFNGSSLNLSLTYRSFIEAVKTKRPEKYIAMNAVNQYGQKEIAAASTDFLYTEVWNPYETYYDLSNLIKQNNTFSNNTKNTVLAAYMNYGLAENKGYFNTASVLMTNAVIFAFGGAHLELGEHMLGREYFPNNNLELKGDLKKSLPIYYDFLVAYQNLLRDGGEFNSVAITSPDGKLPIAAWPASMGKVATFGKKVGSKQVIHFINFKNAKTLNWRDNTGIQVMPGTIANAQLAFTSEGEVKDMWVASPDFIGGASRTINFAQNGNKVSFTLPEIQYWTMVVVEY